MFVFLPFLRQAKKRAQKKHKKLFILKYFQKEAHLNHMSKSLWGLHSGSIFIKVILNLSLMLYFRPMRECVIIQKQFDPEIEYEII